MTVSKFTPVTPVYYYRILKGYQYHIENHKKQSFVNWLRYLKVKKVITAIKTD